MADRESIISSLRYCSDSNPHCLKCQYNKWGIACIDHLAADALSLLAPEARVLTIEDVKNNVGEVLWNEWRSYREREDEPLRPMTPVCVERVGPCVICEEEIEVIEFTDGMDTVADYGIRYRMWSARPTDDQRREAAWENGNLH